MTFPLDVNVLIALVDPTHGLHNDAHVWFEAEGRHSWATCPLTENGVVRIVGNPRYPNSPGPPAVVAAAIGKFFLLPGHIFWPDDLSLFDTRHIDINRITASRQVTDTYLVALAKERGGQLATFDRRLSTNAIEDGGRYLLQIAATTI